MIFFFLKFKLKTSNNQIDDKGGAYIGNSLMGLVNLKYLELKF